MAAQQHFLGFVSPRGESSRATLVGMPFFHERPVRPDDLIARGAAMKAKDLIGLVLGHSARRSRALRPRVRVTVTCPTPAGKAAIEIRL